MEAESENVRDDVENTPNHMPVYVLLPYTFKTFMLKPTHASVYTLWFLSVVHQF